MLVSAHYPPDKSAASTVMKNLFSHFEPESYSVVQRKPRDCAGFPIKRYSIFSDIHFSFHINQYWQALQVPLAKYRLKTLVRQIRPKIILSVYPDFHHLKVGFEVSTETDIPTAIYLHDTVAESLWSTGLRKKAADLQEQIIQSSALIFVITQGLVDLFQNKYHRSTILLKHIYKGGVQEEYREINNRQASFGGSIYGINACALSRIAQALRQEGYSLNLSTQTNKKYLLQRGIINHYSQVKFYPDYSEYLAALGDQELLIVGLDWPEETSIHRDELATIFPTKLPEYLAAGRPIFVHCPQDYYLARFINQYGCGLVVSEPSMDCLIKGLQRLDESNFRKELSRNAIKTARLFSQNGNSQIFRDELTRFTQSNCSQSPSYI